MTTLVSCKLTATEVELLDWLRCEAQTKNRSDALRYALCRAAFEAGARGNVFARIRQERDAHPPKGHTRRIVVKDNRPVSRPRKGARRKGRA